MQDNPFKLIGIILLVIGILDVGYMIYSVMNGVDYASSLNIFAIIIGILLIRGNARTARVTRWGSLAFAIFSFGGLLTLLAITPEALFATQMKLDSMGAVMPYVQLLLTMALSIFTFVQLSSRLALEKLDEANFRTGIPFSAIGMGVVFSGVMLYFMLSILSGESADRAKQLAREQLGDGFNYHVTSINVVNNSGVATVSAYNSNEIRVIEVSW